MTTSESRRFRHRSASIGVFPAAELASVVGAAFGVVAQLDDRCDVQDMVHPPVPGPRQPMADLLAGGGVQGAVPVQEANRFRSANRAMSPTSARSTGSCGCDAVDVHQPRAPVLDRGLELGLELSRTWRRPRPGRRVPRPRSGVGSSRRCRGAGRWPASPWPAARRGRGLRWPGMSSLSSRWSRFTVCTRRPARASRRSVSIRNASSSPSGASTRSPALLTATIAMEWASRASVLRLWPVSNNRTRAASLAGTSSTCSPASRAVGPATGRHRWRPRPPTPGPDRLT